MKSPQVVVFEVGPRDGLQNEDRQIPTGSKIKLVEMLADAGLRHIEITSFVSPSWVPQMSDATDVMAASSKIRGITCAALAPNMKGYDTALMAGSDEVAIFTSASETFCRKNVNCSISESFERFLPLVECARSDGVPVRGYVSCIVDCPYEGAVDPGVVARISARLIDIGCYEVSLGDTTGAGTPNQISDVLAEVVAAVPPSKLAGHFHDTNGLALDNIEESLKFGLRCFDASIGGLGGCPYAPGAKGNVSTLSVANRLKSLGYETGIDLVKLQEAEVFARSLVRVPA